MDGPLYTAPVKPEGPSPWWMRGGAIFIGIIGMGAVINAIFMFGAGIVLEVTFESLENERGEVCDDAEGSIECEEFDTILDIMRAYSESGMWHTGAALSALVFLFTFPTVMVMWSNDRGTGLKIAWAWLGLHAFSSFYFVREYTKISYLHQLEEVPPWVATFEAVATYGGTIFCELLLAAVLVLITYQTKPPTAIELPSGFHQDSPPES
ncbi:MAG: hypothetical protein QF377_01135 [Candidatus Thalassarchaeum sp.]|nr:hypothetical protein [Candidatus Thalassarchaeum sp.]MDP7004320.1 hypothetical protein [Candidatus Thalassarchaeaceae archaeon]